MRLTNIKKLLHQFPSFLDRSSTSNHYLVNNVVNDTFNTLRVGLNNLSLSRDLNRPILIWKTQSVEGDYSIHFHINLSNLKVVNIYEVDPFTQTWTLISEEKFTDESESCIFEYTYSGVCTSNIPLLEYVVTVETWTEFKYIKGFPENDTGTIDFCDCELVSTDEDTFYSLKFDVKLLNLSKVKLYQLHKSSDGVLDWVNIVSRDDLTDDGFTVNVDEQLLRDDNGDLVLDAVGEPSTNPEYGLDYLLVAGTSDDYFFTQYFGASYHCVNYEAFDHDNSLDLIGGRLNIPRRKYIHVNPEQFYLTSPTFTNRYDEDDYTYMNRIIKYINDYPTKNLTELEVWKYYGIDTELINRKVILAEQDTDYMWETGCAYDDDEAKNPTNITFTTSNQAIILTPKKINVSVTSTETDPATNIKSTVEVLSGTVTFTIGDKTYDVEVSDGDAYIYYTPLNFENVLVYAQYNANETYDSTEVISQELQVNKRTPTLTTKTLSVMHGDSVKLHAHVSFRDESINEGNIIFTLNGEELTRGSVSNNNVDADFVIPYDWDYGTVNIRTVFTDTSNYNTTTSYLKVYVRKEKADTRLNTIFFTASGVSVRLFDTLYNQIKDRTIRIYRNNQLLGKVKTLDKGYSTLNYDTDGKPFKIADDDIVTAVFNGDSNYNKSSCQVYPLNPAVNPDTHIDCIYILSHNLRFKLRDGDYNTLIGKNLWVRRNGQGLNTEEIVQTKDWCSFTLPSFSESDIITIDFDGDEVYEKASFLVDTQVANANIIKSYVNVDNLTCATGTSVDLKCKLSDGAGNGLKSRSILFKVNDTIIGTFTTDSSGVATAPYTASTDDTYTITCTFNGDNLYSKSTGTGKLISGGTNSFIRYLFVQPSIVGVLLYTSGNIRIGNETITLKKNGTSIGTYTTNLKGWSNWLDLGTYKSTDIFTLEFAGNDNIVGCTSTIDLTALTRPVLTGKATKLTLTSNVDTVTVKGEILLEALLTDKDNNPIPNTTINFSDGSKNSNVTTNSEGIASYKYSNTVQGLYTITGTFNGNTNYDTSTSTTTVRIIGQENNYPTVTSLTSPANVLYCNEPYNFTVKVTSNNTSVNEGIVTLLKDGIIIGNTQIIDSVATFNYTPPTKDKSSNLHNFQAIYNGTKNYLKSNSNMNSVYIYSNTLITLTTDKELIGTNESATLTAYLTDTLGNPITNRAIIFYNDGVKLNECNTDATGKSIGVFTNTVKGTYDKIVATFNGGEGYNNTTSSPITITVGDNKPFTNLSFKSTSIYRGDYLTVILTNKKTGAIISSQPIYFKLGGNKIYNNNGSYYLTDSNGEAKLLIDLDADAFSNFFAEAFYDDSKGYNASTVSSNITLSRKPTNILIDKTSVNQGDSVCVTLTDVNNVPLKDKTINFYNADTNTKFASSTTGTDGKAYLQFNMDPVTANMKYSFTQDDYYLGSSDTITNFTVNKRTYCIDTIPGRNGSMTQGGNITTTVTDCSTGAALNGKQVYWYFKSLSTGKEQTLGPVTTSGDGSASYTINYDIGEYQVGVIVVGDSTYSQMDTKGNLYTISINTGKSICFNTTPGSGGSMTQGDNITTTVTDCSTGATLNGKQIYWYFKQVSTGNSQTLGPITTSGSGTASYQINYEPGQYQVGVIFEGDGSYAPKDDTNSLFMITVNAKPTSESKTYCLNTMPGRGGSMTQGTYITTTVTDCSTGAYLNGKQVYWYFKQLSTGNEQTLGPVTTSGNGSASYKINYDTGQYYVAVIVKSDGTYPEKSTKDNLYTITINSAYVPPAPTKIGTSITIANTNLTTGGTLGFYLRNSSGTGLSGKTVYITHNGGTLYATTNSVGYAAVTLNDAGQTFTCNYGFNGDDSYDSCNGSSTVTISKKVTKISISSNTVRSGDSVNVTLTDIDGNGISGKAIYFKTSTGSVFATRTTNSSGVANLVFNMTAMTNVLMKYGFDGGNDGYYQSIENSTYMTITLREICFNSNITNGTVFPKGGTYSCTLTDCSTGALLSGKSLSLTIERYNSAGTLTGGQTLYPASSGSDGKVNQVLNYDRLDGNGNLYTYKYYITFSTDGYYATRTSESRKITFTMSG